MKSLILHFFLLMFFGVGYSQEESEIITSGDNYILKFDSIYYNLDSLKVDENGLVIINFIKRPDGYWKDFYYNGKLAFEGRYKDNKPIGLNIFYSVDGKIHRIHYYDEDGILVFSQLFINQEIPIKIRFNKTKVEERPKILFE